MRFIIDESHHTESDYNHFLLPTVQQHTTICLAAAWFQVSSGGEKEAPLVHCLPMCINLQVDTRCSCSLSPWNVPQSKKLEWIPKLQELGFKQWFCVYQQYSMLVHGMLIFLRQWYHQKVNISSHTVNWKKNYLCKASSRHGLQVV